MGSEPTPQASGQDPGTSPGGQGRDAGRSDAGRLAGELASIVGPEHVHTDADRRASFEVDWMGRRLGRCLLAVEPASTAEVAAVLATCRSAGVGVVPQGGNTGLVGGGVPRGGEVVLSTRRMSAVGPVDPTAGHVRAGAGATLQSVADAAGEAGFDVPVDLASRGSATIGGMVATDAGGLRVLRHGSMRAHVRGLEAVLADGTVVSRLAGLAKDTAGYHLPSLLCGSEGTLAVVTEVVLSLVPSPTSRVTALVGLPGLEAALSVLAALRHDLDGLESAEVVFADGVELVRSQLGVAGALRGGAACQLLVEATGREAGTDELTARVGDAIGRAAPGAEAAVATDERTRARLWEVRERHPELVARLGQPVKLDVSLPLGRLAEFELRVRTVVAEAAPGAPVVLFGHAGDGGLHVNVAAGPGSGPVEHIAAAVFGLVAELDGSVSAEHGIGVDKVRWLGLTRSPEEIGVMRRIKEALDPDRVLNPGVLLG